MERITILKGPDRVRKRPAVIFTSQDIYGVENAVNAVLDLYAYGHCKNLTVIHRGEEMTIIGDDRGIYLGDGSDDNVWKNIFCEIYPGPRRIDNEEPYIFSGLNTSPAILFEETRPDENGRIPDSFGHMELCAVQFASLFMQVTVVRDGVKRTLNFEKGYSTGEMQSECTIEQTGTTFHFAMDPEVFTNVILPESYFIKALVGCAKASPGLTCTYINLEKGSKQTIVFPDDTTV